MAALLALCWAEGWLRALPQAGRWLQNAMAANWLSFGAGQVVVAASGLIPASLIAVMAGASFGLLKGVAISAASTMLGGWVAFRLSRGALRGFIARRLQRHAGLVRLDQSMAREGWRFVMLLRVSPVMPFALTSYALGLTQIDERDFLLGTLASLPALTAYVAIGAMGKQGLAMASDHASAWRWCVLVAGFAVIGYALWRLRRALQRIAA
jgi:uncharacterized membrane protein YdjX (TVP38/TMEM64 family)